MILATTLPTIALQVIAAAVVVIVLLVVIEAVRDALAVPDLAVPRPPAPSAVADSTCSHVPGLNDDGTLANVYLRRGGFLMCLACCDRYDRNLIDLEVDAFRAQIDGGLE